MAEALEELETEGVAATLADAAGEFNSLAEALTEALAEPETEAEAATLADAAGEPDALTVALLEKEGVELSDGVAVRDAEEEGEIDGDPLGDTVIDALMEVVGVALTEPYVTTTIGDRPWVASACVQAPAPLQL